MINPQTIEKGDYVYEEFYSNIKKRNLIEFNYRALNGKLFTCICTDFKKCVEKLHIWIKENDLVDWPSIF